MLLFVARAVLNHSSLTRLAKVMSQIDKELQVLHHFWCLLVVKALNMLVAVVATTLRLETSVTPIMTLSSNRKMLFFIKF